MAKRDLKREYESLEEKSSVLEDQSEAIAVEQARIQRKLSDLEVLWGENHSCDCGLLGMEATCTHNRGEG